MDNNIAFPYWQNMLLDSIWNRFPLLCWILPNGCSQLCHWHLRVLCPNWGHGITVHGGLGELMATGIALQSVLTLKIITLHIDLLFSCLIISTILFSTKRKRKRNLLQEILGLEIPEWEKNPIEVKRDKTNFHTFCSALVEWRKVPWLGYLWRETSES